jgi:hypothetical protein
VTALGPALAPASGAQRAVLLSAGADPKVVQRVLGHATASMTMDLYGHLVDGNLWQAAQLVGGTTGASEPPEQTGDDEDGAGAGESAS